VNGEAAPFPEQWNIATAVNLALHSAFDKNPKLLALGEDIADPIGGVWRTFKGLSTAYGTDRVRATPIAEQAIVGSAIGASLGGYSVVAEIMFFDFVTVCLDQILNHAAKLRYMSGGATPVPVTLCTTVGSGRFGAQHTQSLEAWFMHVPGIKVVYPSNPSDAHALMTSCLEDPDPCLFIQHSGFMFRRAPGPETPPSLKIGTAKIARNGTDVTVVAYGVAVADALTAADELAADGISVEVVDLCSLVPLDIETVLDSVSRTKRAIVVHHATKFCGPGSEVAMQIHESLHSQLTAPVVRLGAAEVPIPFAGELNPFPTCAEIIEAARLLAGPSVR
jgi:acetoin:2,6-dichlorophenolindophenol oxidoreductase subunit beta